jgi:hypothetical protein
VNFVATGRDEEVDIIVLLDIAFRDKICDVDIG